MNLSSQLQNTKKLDSFADILLFTDFEIDSTTIKNVCCYMFKFFLKLVIAMGVAHRLSDRQLGTGVGGGWGPWPAAPLGSRAISRVGPLTRLAQPARFLTATSPLLGFTRETEAFAVKILTVSGFSVEVLTISLFSGTVRLRFK